VLRAGTHRDGDAGLDQVHPAAGDDATDDLLRAAHSLKSSSLNVGALSLGELCRTLEADARGGPVADPGPRVDAIASGFDAVRVALLDERGRRAAG
jgi:HPt (histidine-containing phosphotransfer) domain-containing protein